MIRRLRLGSGLVMLAYVATHLLNTSLVLVSVDVADAVLHDLYRVWTSRVGTTLIYGAFVIHYCLALYALWRRRTLRMSPAEATQLVLGFCIPYLLTEHVVSTRVADSAFHADFGYYISVLAQYGVMTPWRGINQLVVLVVAWVHAMIGLRYNLALRPWYPRWQPYLFAAALLVPTLAILGMFEGVLHLQALAKNPDFLAQLQADHPHARPIEDAAILGALTMRLRLVLPG